MTIEQHRGRRCRRLAGGALALAATMLAAAAPAHATFGLKEVKAAFTGPTAPVPIEDPWSLTPVTQAGSHPDLTISLSLNVRDVNGAEEPDGSLRSAVVDLPKGFYGNPRAVGVCPMPLFIVNDAPMGTECPGEAQVGVGIIQIDSSFVGGGIYNLRPGPNEAARLGLSAVGVPVLLSLRVGPDGRLRTVVENANQTLPIQRVELTLWGHPSDPAHDPWRFTPVTQPSGRPFLTAPPLCGAPPTIDVRVRSWQAPSVWDAVSKAMPAMTGCELLPFNASLALRPESPQADAPSAYNVDLQVDQTDDVSQLSAGLLRDAVVQLPEGTAISPSAASGLHACDDGQIGVGTLNEPACTPQSKVGTVQIHTPLLDQALTGEIFLGNPQTGAMFRLWLIARGPGVLLKIPGTVAADASTGRLTATFANAPALPFNALKLRFAGGDRAVLANPATCGYKAVGARLASWSGQSVGTGNGFTIDRWDDAGTLCPEGGAPFAPSFQAGTLTAQPATESGFVLSVRRPDRHKTIDRLSVDLPAGLLGQVSKVPLCGEEQAAAGACSADSRVGSVGIEAGSGGMPFPLTGDVFLAGPYKGAPFSLSIVVNALAGPFDLGKVVVRAPIRVDAANAKLAIESDSIPSMLAGIPLRIRTINITIDRPGFMHTPANCASMAVNATVYAGDGSKAEVSSPYQADGCAGLPFEPKISFSTTGNGGANGANLVTRIEQGLGEGHLRSLKVLLPAKLSPRLSTAGQACPPEVFDRNPAECPALSKVGTTTAVTPALPAPLTGPVYIVLNPNGGLPSLRLVLEGEGAASGIGLRLDGKVAIENGLTAAEFDGIPDVPLSSFELDLVAGKDSVLEGRNLCRGNPVVGISAIAHHGAVKQASLPLQRIGCPTKSAASKSKAKKAGKKGKGKAAKRGRVRR